MKTSAQYKVFDHKENRVIADKANINQVVALTGIPYTKVSVYASSGYRYNKRYTVEKTDVVLDMIMDDLYVTLMSIKGMVSEDRFRKLTFVRKQKG